MLLKNLGYEAFLIPGDLYSWGFTGIAYGYHFIVIAVVGQSKTGLEYTYRLRVSDQTTLHFPGSLYKTQSLAIQAAIAKAKSIRHKVQPPREWMTKMLSQLGIPNEIDAPSKNPLSGKTISRVKPYKKRPLQK